MTIKELTEALSKYDPDSKCFISFCFSSPLNNKNSTCSKGELNMIVSNYDEDEITLMSDHSLLLTDAIWGKENER